MKVPLGRETEKCGEAMACGEIHPGSAGHKYRGKKA
jgi:hypothetical protein